jgi:hypothetical protein
MQRLPGNQGGSLNQYQYQNGPEWGNTEHNRMASALRKEMKQTVSGHTGMALADLEKAVEEKMESRTFTLTRGDAVGTFLLAKQGKNFSWNQKVLLDEKVVKLTDKVFKSLRSGVKIGFPKDLKGPNGEKISAVIGDQDYVAEKLASQKKSDSEQNQNKAGAEAGANTPQLGDKGPDAKKTAPDISTGTDKSGDQEEEGREEEEQNKAAANTENPPENLRLHQHIPVSEIDLVTRWETAQEFLNHLPAEKFEAAKKAIAQEDSISEKARQIKTVHIEGLHMYTMKLRGDLRKLEEEWSWFGLNENEEEKDFYQRKLDVIDTIVSTGYDEKNREHRAIINEYEQFKRDARSDTLIPSYRQNDINQIDTKNLDQKTREAWLKTADHLREKGLYKEAGNIYKALFTQSEQFKEDFEFFKKSRINQKEKEVRKNVSKDKLEAFLMEQGLQGETLDQELNHIYQETVQQTVQAELIEDFLDGESFFDDKNEDYGLDWEDGLQKEALLRFKDMEGFGDMETDFFARPNVSDYNQNELWKDIALNVGLIAVGGIVGAVARSGALIAANSLTSGALQTTGVGRGVGAVVGLGAEATTFANVQSGVTRGETATWGEVGSAALILGALRTTSHLTRNIPGLKKQQPNGGGFLARRKADVIDAGIATTVLTGVNGLLLGHPVTVENISKEFLTVLILKVGHRTANKWLIRQNPDGTYTVANSKKIGKTNEAMQKNASGGVRSLLEKVRANPQNPKKLQEGDSIIYTNKGKDLPGKIIKGKKSTGEEMLQIKLDRGTTFPLNANSSAKIQKVESGKNDSGSKTPKKSWQQRLGEGYRGLKDRAPRISKMKNWITKPFQGLRSGKIEKIRKPFQEKSEQIKKDIEKIEQKINNKEQQIANLEKKLSGQGTRPLEIKAQLRLYKEELKPLHRELKQKEVEGYNNVQAYRAKLKEELKGTKPDSQKAVQDEIARLDENIGRLENLPWYRGWINGDRQRFTINREKFGSTGKKIGKLKTRRVKLEAEKSGVEAGREVPKTWEALRKAVEGGQTPVLVWKDGRTMKIEQVNDSGVVASGVKTPSHPMQGLFQNQFISKDEVVKLL